MGNEKNLDFEQQKAGKESKLTSSRQAKSGVQSCLRLEALARPQIEVLLMSGGVSIAVMQTRQYGHRNDLALNPIEGRRSTVDEPSGNPLLDAWVGTMLIVVGTIFCDDAL